MLSTIITIALVFTFIASSLYLLTRKRLIRVPYVPEKGSHFVEINGVKLHYVFEFEENHSPPVLLLHGIAANIYCWRRLTPLISPKARVWALDLKGFGLSQKPWPSDYGLKAQAELVASFIEKEIKEKCIIVGSSMGGAIALELTLSHPDLVRELVLISPAYDSGLVWLDPRKFKALMPLSRMLANPILVKGIIKSLYGKSLDVSDSDVDAYLNPYMDANARNAVVDAFSAITDTSLKDRIQNIHCPALIIWGEKDRVTPADYADEIQKRIQGSQLFIHPTAGHHIQEEEPQWLADKITEFTLK